MNIREIIANSESWLRRRRWYDLKDQKIKSIKLFWSLKIGDIYLTVIKVKAANRTERFYYIPLLIEVSTSSHYCEEINKLYICEAEYYPTYYNSFFTAQSQNYTNDLIIKPYSRLEASRIVEPITGSTNPVVKIVDEKGNSSILKSYRKIYKINREFLFLKKLQTKLSNIPKLLASLKHKKWGVFSIITQYVKSLSDGGMPFAKNLIEYLEYSSDLPETLAWKLGEVTARFHNCLIDDTELFFKPEDINYDDILKWKNRIFNRLKFLGLTSSSLETHIKNFHLHLGIKKVQIHQDYHLAQLLYTIDNDFIILDFEGEPGRDYRELLVKEPAVRDLGCMIRSFDYLVYSILSNILNLKDDKIYEVISKNEKILEWRCGVIEAFLMSYLRNIEKEVLGNFVDFKELTILTLPWILEKALYEAIYEKKYRPQYLYIPLNGIQEFTENLHPMFQLIKHYV